MTNKLAHKIIPLLLMLAGTLVLVIGLLYYLSPKTRLQLYGVVLQQQVAASGPANFIVGWHSHVKTWTEHEGQLDTPLGDETTDEISTLLVDRLRGTATENIIQIKAKEWIRSVKNNTAFTTQVIPLNHPSIAPGTILLDKQWTLLERQPKSAWRMGRAFQFLIPKFPKGPLHPGSTWKEHLEWTEMAGTWRFGWGADLQWVLKGYDDTRYAFPCALLTYTASLEPTLLQEAFWSKGASQPTFESAKVNGEALYNIREKFVISNTLTYSGKAKIHIQRLEDVPEDLRIGVPLVNSDGDVVFQFNDKIDVRLP